MLGVTFRYLWSIFIKGLKNNRQSYECECCWRLIFHNFPKITRAIRKGHLEIFQTSKVIHRFIHLQYHWEIFNATELICNEMQTWSKDTWAGSQPIKIKHPIDLGYVILALSLAYWALPLTSTSTSINATANYSSANNKSRCNTDNVIPLKRITRCWRGSCWV